MDAWQVAEAAVVVVVVALLFAIWAVLASRGALTKANAAAVANRVQVDRAKEAAQVARREASAAVARLAEVERKLIDSETELKLALQRTMGLEGRLNETEERLRQATEALPPPRIPSGRSVARLNDLRATLRAQAAESGDAEDGRAR
jgi:hypothetical protein